MVDNCFEARIPQQPVEMSHHMLNETGLDSPVVYSIPVLFHNITATCEDFNPVTDLALSKATLQHYIYRI
jgi:hypothetical protein